MYVSVQKHETKGSPRPAAPRPQPSACGGDSPRSSTRCNAGHRHPPSTCRAPKPSSASGLSSQIYPSVLSVACLFTAKPSLATRSRESSLPRQYTEHDRSVGSTHESPPCKPSCSSLAQHLEESFYDPNKNSPEQVSYSHNVLTRANPPRSQRGAEPSLLRSPAPGRLCLFSSPVSHNELRCCPLLKTKSSLF